MDGGEGSSDSGGDDHSLMNDQVPTHAHTQQRQISPVMVSPAHTHTHKRQATSPYRAKVQHIITSVPIDSCVCVCVQAPYPPAPAFAMPPPNGFTYPPTTIPGHPNYPQYSNTTTVQQQYGNTARQSQPTGLTMRLSGQGQGQGQASMRGSHVYGNGFVTPAPVPYSGVAATPALARPAANPVVAAATGGARSSILERARERAMAATCAAAAAPQQQGAHPQQVTSGGGSSSGDSFLST